MSYGEFLTWAAYRRKFGPLDPVRKYDRGLAVVASAINRAFGGSSTPKDYMPYGKLPEADEVWSSPAEFIAALGPKVKYGR